MKILVQENCLIFTLMDQICFNIVPNWPAFHSEKIDKQLERISLQIDVWLLYLLNTSYCQILTKTYSWYSLIHLKSIAKMMFLFFFCLSHTWQCSWLVFPLYPGFTGSTQGLLLVLYAGVTPGSAQVNKAGCILEKHLTYCISGNIISN